MESPFSFLHPFVEIQIGFSWRTSQHPAAAFLPRNLDCQVMEQIGGSIGRDGATLRRQVDRPATESGRPAGGAK
jgi:hypothetical protein